MTIILGCASPQVLYLENNIHTQSTHRGELKASYANWIGANTGHVVIPVNTPIVIGRWRPGFYFVTQDTRKRVYFEYNQRNMPYSVREYIDLITSPEPVPETSFSELDLEGIRAGKALTGMSKEGVRVALGYPATHRTPSMEEAVWVYWKNRHRQVRVVFGTDDKVIAVR